jgi:hypothetical protein
MKFAALAVAVLAGTAPAGPPPGHETAAPMTIGRLH